MRTHEGQSAASGFHDGELAVQQQAGVRGEAGRLEGMLASVGLRSGIVTFLTDRTSPRRLPATPTAGCGRLRSSV